jgi:hypothetical protein
MRPSCTASAAWTISSSFSTATVEVGEGEGSVSGWWLGYGKRRTVLKAGRVPAGILKTALRLGISIKGRKVKGK